MERSKERKQVTLRIFRGLGSDRSKDRYEVFTVPYEDGMVVLNAIHYIQSHLDSSLSARWNCKAGHCGSCSAEINGWPRLMCKTPVADFDGDITIEPMKAFPLIRDLVTDVSENYEIAKKIPPFTPKDSKDEVWKMYQEDVDKGREFRKCIECFLCQDICHVVREHKADYIGPRFIVKAASFDMHPFDKLDRSDYLKETAGIGYCNITKCCQEVCPEHIIITDDAIIPEKERVVDTHYDPILWVYRKVKGSDKPKSTD
ncbi:MAG: succinate dehydrogenase/fumarate reductase iron-sulfur subunit [Nitrososphaerales archaeon]|jgi:succinate dehydrogenase / fumarate reductase, iron-sulfur subunit